MNPARPPRPRGTGPGGGAMLSYAAWHNLAGIMAGAEARRFDIPAVIGVRCDAGRGFRPKAATPGRSTATTAHDAMQVVALSFTTNLECAFLLAFEPLPSTLEKPTVIEDTRTRVTLYRHSIMPVLFAWIGLGD